MNIKNVLLPTDLSDFNCMALAYASVLAAESGATLHILHVDDVQDVSSDALEIGYQFGAPWDQIDGTSAREKLSEIRPTNSAVSYQHHYARGTPAREIIGFAETNGVDLIVMASHGRTGLARLVMGSVAEEVARRAPCPVLIVKQPFAAHNSQKMNYQKSASK